MNKRVMLAVVGSVATAFVAGVAIGANQPHMEDALRALEHAKAELAVAEHNKGGHRDKAARLVQDAIHQVREGIAVGNR